MLHVDQNQLHRDIRLQLLIEVYERGGNEESPSDGAGCIGRVLPLLSAGLSYNAPYYCNVLHAVAHV